MVLSSVILRTLTTMASKDCAPLETCVFCRVVSDNDPTKIIYQDDEVVAFPDIKPASDRHYLIIPRSHILNPKVLDQSHKSLVEHMVKVAHELLQDTDPNLTNSRFGFHWPPFNTISHLHLHAISPADRMNFMSKMIFRPDSYWFKSPESVLLTLPEVKAEDNTI